MILKVITRSIAGRVASIGFSALMLGAFSQASAMQNASMSADEDFRAFDLATTWPMSELLVAANEGDLAAQYAVFLVAQNGLQGRSVDLAVSTHWRRIISNTEPLETETVTQFVPARGGQPAHARTTEIRVNVRARAFARAYDECVADILGIKPNPVACGSTPEDRERRKSAWRAAIAR